MAANEQSLEPADVLALAKAGRWSAFFRAAAQVDVHSLRDREGFRPLHWAALVGAQGEPPSGEHIDALARLGVDIHARTAVRGDTALQLAAAAEGDHVRVVAALVEAGADVLLVNGVGETPLIAATRARNELVFLFLLRTALAPTNACASIDAGDEHGHSALHYAVLGGSLWMARQLLDAGASVDVLSLDGRAPLHLAVAAAEPVPELVEMLLVRGASVSLRDDSGATPADLLAAMPRTMTDNSQPRLAVGALVRLATTRRAALVVPPTRFPESQWSALARGGAITLASSVYLLAWMGVVALALAVPAAVCVTQFCHANRYIVAHPAWTPSLVWTTLVAQLAYLITSLLPGHPLVAVQVPALALGVSVIALFWLLTTSSSGLYLHPRARARSGVAFTLPPDDSAVGIDVYARTRADAAHMFSFCLECERTRERRAKHCRTCGGCVPVMDHHCAVTGACVGAGQHRAFVLFVTTTALYCTVALALAAAREPLASALVLQPRAWAMYIVTAPLDALLVVVLVLGWLMTAALTVSQLFFVAMNVTFNEQRAGLRYGYMRAANEQLDNPFDSGPLVNCLLFWRGEDRRETADARRARVAAGRALAVDASHEV